MSIRRSLKEKIFKGNFNKNLLLIIPAILLVIFAFMVEQNYEVPTKEVKVLIYSGPETSPNCIGKMEGIMNDSNTNNLTGNIKFVYNTSNIINSETLNSYDVLIMPGTNIGYDYVSSENVDSAAVKSFVANGNGFVGICAGAYSGALYTDGWYNNWGIAPHVVAEPYLDEGNITVLMADAGENTLGYNGTKTMPHINGPKMHSNGSTVVFAYYYDNDTGSTDSEAIVGDFYGNGRTVLSGVHPELEPQHPQMLIKILLWAANIT